MLYKQMGMDVTLAFSATFISKYFQILFLH